VCPLYDYSKYIGESGESIEFDSYIVPTEEQKEWLINDIRYSITDGKYSGIPSIGYSGL
jgi:hypothetical protein